MWSISYVTCVDIIAQVSLTPWSISLFLDKLTQKLRIIIIILLTDWPKIILSTACTTKIKLPSPYYTDFCILQIFVVGENSTKS